jgi:DNA polymerase-3 subunit delta'
MQDERSLPWLAAPLAQLREHQRGHALLLQGAAGSALLELALRVAQAWLCESPPGPCDHCDACRLTSLRHHPDLLLLWPEAMSVAAGEADGEEAADAGESDTKSRRKPSREIRIDAARRAIDWAQTSPARGRGKVLVVHPAEALNPTAAQALLKSLEEPPGSLRWLLCTQDLDRLLPTLRSRCQHLRIASPDSAAALQWLTAAGVADAEVLLAAAGGEPLAAQQLAAEGLSAAAWQALPRQVAAGEAGALAGLPLPRVVDVLQQLCHDAMAVAAGAPPRYFAAAAWPPIGRDGATWRRLLAWSRALTEAARHAEHPWNAPLRVESLVLQGADALARRAAA